MDRANAYFVSGGCGLCLVWISQEPTSSGPLDNRGSEVGSGGSYFLVLLVGFLVSSGLALSDCRERIDCFRVVRLLCSSLGVLMFVRLDLTSRLLSPQGSPTGDSRGVAVLENMVRLQELRYAI